LIQLNAELVPGQQVPITLRFEDGSEQTLSAPVRKLQMRMGPPAH
jgi:copper(I)-binding protein